MVFKDQHFHLSLGEATITLEDNEDKLDFENCKYILSEEENTENISDHAVWVDIESKTIEFEKLMSAGDYYLHVIAKDKDGNETKQTSSKVTVAETKDFDYLENDEGEGQAQKVLLLKGNYQFECWGASRRCLFNWKKL